MKRTFVGIKSFGSRGRLFLLAFILAITATLGNLPISQSAHAAIGSMTEYNLAVSGAFVDGIGLGPDGRIWYTAYGPTINSRIGQITTSGVVTEYLNRATGVNPKSPKAITQVSDGNILYSEYLSTNGVTQIVKLSTAGSVLGIYPVSSGGIPSSMTLGPDGAVWFGQVAGVGRIDTTGTITQYPVGKVTSVTTGPDGNIWYTIAANGVTAGNGLGKITMAGTVTAYPLGIYNSQPEGITTGPDGNLWFTFSEVFVGKIGKMTTSGVTTKYTIPTSGSQPTSMALGSDGNLWFIQGGNKIGRISTSGIFSVYTVASTAALSHIIRGPDGAVWFQNGNTKIVRIATELTNQIISFTSAAPVGATVDSPSYTPTASATSGLPVTITVDPLSSAVCSIDGFGLVTYLSAGTCMINADQSGNADYNPATQVQQSFTVLPVNADSEVSVSCPSTVTVMSVVTCTITMTNNGPADAENASLTAIFSNSLTSPSLSGGGSISGQYITWTVPSLVSGTSATLTFNAIASLAGKVLLNAALLQTSPDPDVLNNITGAAIIAS